MSKTVLNQIDNDNCDKGFFIENLCVISLDVRNHISAALNIEQNYLSVGVKAKNSKQYQWGIMLFENDWSAGFRSHIY